jgi:hypothetical protein
MFAGDERQRSCVMLTVEHFAAEALRYERLKAYAMNRGRHDGLSWLLGMFWSRTPKLS